MYGIFCDIWKNPERGFTPMQRFELCGEGDESRLAELYKNGICGIVLHPAEGGDCLSDEYFRGLTSLAAAAKKRFMSVAIGGESSAFGEIIQSEERLSARRLYALPAHTVPPSNEELLYRISVKFDENGRLTDTKLDPAEGYEEYDLVLGYSCEAGTVDMLNPMTAEKIICRVLDGHHARLGEYFGDTVIGYFADAPAFAEGEIPWTYGFIEDFFEMGGDIHTLAALFFEPREKKYRREAEYALGRAISSRLRAAYYAPLAKWCAEHKIALMGHPAGIAELDSFDVPGAVLKSADVCADRATEAALLKCTSDFARHRGLARSMAELSFEGELTPDSVMQSVNFAFARGASLALADSFSLHGDSSDAEARGDMKKLTSYIKRMSWLASTGTNNPVCAVLCTPEYIPHTPVRALWENGYTFNYLTLSDLMERASVKGGKILIDRYAYGIILIDSRLRLDAESVTKIGRFVTEGGLMYRGGDFIGFIERNVKRGSGFVAEGGKNAENLRFSHITKSGCDFFVMINEGDAEIRGELLTDIPCEASDFDPMSGEITPIFGTVADGGFSYPVTVHGHSVRVIGMNKNALPHIGEREASVLCEIVSLCDGRMTFEYREEYSRAEILFDDVERGASARVNGADAGRILFKPYVADITGFVISGENTVEVDGDVFGCTVRLYRTV